MLEELLAKAEGKTLEFKENTKSLHRIIQTIVAFANTAGGTLVIGIKDKTKEVIGVKDVLMEEEKIANSVATSILPLLVPTIQLYTYRSKDVLIISVPHSYGPYYIKEAGLGAGTYVRVGSTNRVADGLMIEEIKRSKKQKFFDELPELDATQEDLDLELAAKLFTKAKKKFTLKAAQSLGILVKHQGKLFPSHGGILLFGKEPTAFFPEGYVRLARFAGTTRSEVIDHAEYQGPLATALDPILAFIRRNTRMGARFTEKYREDIPEYPPEVVREAVINALVHADYAIRSSAIMIAIFDDRIEIQNPGILPLGMDLETALEGVSQLRNKVFGRVCLALHLIEQWGSGLRRMVDICTSLGIQPPKFEELGNTFRVTLYSRGSAVESREASWNEPVITHLVRKKKMSAKEAQALWNVSARTTSKRLSEMIREGRIVEVSTGPFDPHKFFVRPK